MGVYLDVFVRPVPPVPTISREEDRLCLGYLETKSTSTAPTDGPPGCPFEFAPNLCYRPAVGYLGDVVDKGQAPD